MLLLVAFTVVAGTLLAAGPDPAAADPAARRARPRPGRGRPRPRRPAPAGRRRRLRAARRAGVRRPPRGGRAGPGPRRPAHVRRLGAARHRRRRGDAVRALRPDPGRDDRGRARQGAAGPQQGQGAVRGREPGARHARHRGVDARRRLRGARRRTLREPRLRRRPHLRRPRRAPRGRHGRRAGLRHLPGRRHPLGVAAAVPRPAATSAAATPPSASTPPPTSTTACTPWWSPPSRTSPGGGATCTTSPADARLAAIQRATRLGAWERPRSSSPPPTTRPSWARPSPATSASTTSAWRPTRPPPRPTAKDLLTTGHQVALFVIDSDQEQDKLYTLIGGTRQAVPTARRLIVTHVSRFRDDNQTFRHAVAAGKVDALLLMPQGPRDEEFHLAVGELLNEWNATVAAPVVENVRIITPEKDAPDPRPARLPRPGRDAGRRAPPRQRGGPRGDGELPRGRGPVAGRVLAGRVVRPLPRRAIAGQPALRPTRRRSTSTRSSTSSWSARARPGWPPACTPRARACPPSASRPRPSAARPAPAR